MLNIIFFFNLPLNKKLMKKTQWKSSQFPSFSSTTPNRKKESVTHLCWFSLDFNWGDCYWLWWSIKKRFQLLFFFLYILLSFLPIRRENGRNWKITSKCYQLPCNICLLDPLTLTGKTGNLKPTKFKGKSGGDLVLWWPLLI